MELKVKDSYRIESCEYLSNDLITSLFMLYQPIMGREATDLYMTLYSEAHYQHNQESHSRLLTLTDMSIDEMEKARIRLEEYLLLKVYMQEQESRNSYIYVLNPPLSVHGFLAQKELMSILTAAIGEKSVASTVGRLQTGAISTAEYKDVTRAVSHARKAQGLDLSVDYSHPKQRYNFTSHDTAINFNYERFLTLTDTLVFPAELRTQENMELIGQLATVYGLSPDRMNILVSRVINLSRMTFDVDRLRLLCQKTQPDISEAKDIYSLPPVAFLQGKQNGAAVSVADRKILENLSVNMKFPPEVINVMIEYILGISQNRLIKSFVDMVAGEWARDGVSDKQQALAETKKKAVMTGSSKKPVREMPAYFSSAPSDTDEKPTDEELREVQDLMKKMGGE